MLVARFQILFLLLSTVPVFAGQTGERAPEDLSVTATAPVVDDLLPRALTSLTEVSRSYDGNGSFRAPTANGAITTTTAKPAPAPAEPSAAVPTSSLKVSNATPASTPVGPAAAPAPSAPAPEAAPTGEVAQGDTRYSDVDGSRGKVAEPTVGSLLSGIGNVKSMADLFAPFGKPLSLSALPRTRGASAPAKTAAAMKQAGGTKKLGKEAEEKKKAEAKEKRDQEVMPGTPGDKTAGKTTFGEDGDAVSTFSEAADGESSGLGESDSDKKKDDKDKKKETPEEKAEREKAEKELKDAIENGDYDQIADQILNNESQVKEMVREDKRLADRTKRLLDENIPKDTNPSRKEAAQRFANFLDRQANDPDAVQSRSTPADIGLRGRTHDGASSRPLLE